MSRKVSERKMKTFTEIFQMKYKSRERKTRDLTNWKLIQVLLIYPALSFTENVLPCVVFVTLMSQLGFDATQSKGRLHVHKRLTAVLETTDNEMSFELIFVANAPWKV